LKRTEKEKRLDDLLQATDVSKIAKGSMKEIVQFLKKIMAESQLQLQSIQRPVLQIIGNLCNGLGQDFAKGAKVLLPQVVLRLRDSKKVTVEIAISTLLRMRKSLSFPYFVNELTSLLCDKNSSLKVNSISVLESIIMDKENEEDLVSEENHGELYKVALSLNSCLSDGKPEVRRASESLLESMKEKFVVNPELFEFPTSPTKKPTPKTARPVTSIKRASIIKSTAALVPKKPVPLPPKKAFNKTKVPGVVKSAAPDINKDLIFFDFDVFMDCLEGCKNSKKFKKIVLLNNTFFETTQQVKKIVDSFKNKGSEEVEAIFVAVAKAVDDGRLTVYQEMLTSLGPSIMKNLPDKKLTTLARNMFDKLYFESGPVHILRLMEEEYYSSNLFSHNQQDIYYEEFIKVILRAEPQYIPIPEAISLIRGWLYYHTTKAVDEALPDLYWISKRLLTEEEFSLIKPDFELLEINENKSYERKYKEVPLKMLNSPAQDSLVGYISHKEPSSSSNFAKTNLDKEVKDLFASEKNSIRLSEKLKTLIIRTLIPEVSKQGTSQILEFLADKMTDSNKQVMKQSVLLCSYFLIHASTSIVISKLFLNSLATPLKDNSNEIRKYAMGILEYMIKIDLKYYKYFIIQFSEAKDATLNFIKLLNRLMESDDKFVVKFEKKTGFPLILDNVTNRKKEIREEAEKVLKHLLKIHDPKAFNSVKRKMKEALASQIDQIIAKLTRQQEDVDLICEEIVSNSVQTSPSTKRKGKEILSNGCNLLSPESIRVSSRPKSRSRINDCEEDGISLFLDLKNLNGDFIKHREMSDLISMHKQHLKESLLLLLSVKDEKRWQDALSLIHSYLMTHSKRAIEFWGFILKIIELMCKPYVSLPLQNALLISFKNMISLRKAARLVMKRQELWVLGVFFIKITELPINEDIILTYFKQITSLVQDTPREKEYFGSVLRNQKMEVYQDYFDKECNELIQLDTPRPQLTRETSTSVKILDCLFEDNAIRKHDENKDAKDISIEILGGTSHHHYDEDDNSLLGDENIECPSLTTLHDYLDVFKKGSSAEIIHTLFAAKDFHIDLEQEEANTLLEGINIAMERVYRRRNSVTERFVHFLADTLMEVLENFKEFDIQLKDKTKEKTVGFRITYSY